MCYQLIVAEQDQAKKLAYFNEMMSLFEARQKNLDVLNTFATVRICAIWALWTAV